MKLFPPHKIILAVIDLVVINLSFLFALWLQYRSGFYYETTQVPYHQIPSFVLFSLGLIAIFQTQRLYKYQVLLNTTDQIVQLLKSLIYGLALFITASFLLKSSYVTQSRLVIGLTFLITSLLLVIARCAIARSAYVYLTGKGIRKRVLIIGAGRKGQKLLNLIQRGKHPYFEVAGFIDDDPKKVGKVHAGVKVLGNLSDIRDSVKDSGIDEILISIDRATHERLLEIVDRCKATGVSVHIVSDLYQVIAERTDVEKFDGMPTVELPIDTQGIVQTVLKRAADLVEALSVLMIW